MSRKLEEKAKKTAKRKGKGKSIDSEKSKKKKMKVPEEIQKIKKEKEVIDKVTEREELTEEEEKFLEKELNKRLNLTSNEKAKLRAWEASKEVEKGESWKEELKRFREMREKGLSKEEVKEKLKDYGGEKVVRAYERAEKEAPELLERSPKELTKEKYDKMFENADKVVAPKKALKTAAEEGEKELQGKLRAHKVKRNGKNVVVLIPKYRKKYASRREEKEVEPTEEFKKKREFKGYNEPEELEKREEMMEKGEIGTAHTHPSERGRATSKDLKYYKEHGIAGIPVPAREEAEKTELARPSEKGGYKTGYEGLKLEKVDFVSKEEIGKLMKGIPEKKAKEKGLPLLKKKKKDRRKK